MTHEDTLKLAIQKQQAGNFGQAMEIGRKLLAEHPDQSDAFHKLGNALLKKGSSDEQAAAALTIAAQLHSDSPQVLNDLAIALGRLRQWDKMAHAAGRAVKLCPTFVPALNTFGHALRQCGRNGEAIQAYRQAVAIQPDFPLSHHNLGNALYETGDFDQAIACYQRVLKLKPDFAPSYSNMANSYCRKGMLDEAAQACGKALVLTPDLPAAHWALANILLLKGDLQNGWREYEWRWKVAELGPRPTILQPLWDGSELGGRRILLHTEQGLGDSIQFFRYAPLVAERGGTVILACQPELHRLFQNQEAISQTVPIDQPWPSFEVHCPLMSLPNVFKTDLTTMPAGVPYLSVDNALKQQFDDLLPRQPGLQKVGLVWAGRPDHFNDRNRSISLSALVPVLEVSNCWFCSLQKGPAASQLHNLRIATELVDFSDRIADMADTAALIDCLDLVICVDTAVAHLAGALGKTVWILIPSAPDWRWMLHRDDSPWYPSMRLFRQEKAGDWGTPVRKMAAELQRLNLKR